MIAQTLKRLFEADIDAEDFYETAPGYELHALLGWPPWAPMLCALWVEENRPDDPQLARVFDKYRAELLELHRQYREGSA